MSSTVQSEAPEAFPAAGSASKPAYDLWNRVAAAAVGIFIFVIYRITLSPDVSFWDSGEFIATSHSLGIPHPPGTPLYVLMGRFFSILLSGVLNVASPAQAVNLLSAIPSAIAAVFLHLCVVRVGKKIWNDGDQTTFCFPALVAGITAAIFAGFANTLWINSIEAEVYAVSGMWAVFAAWLILVWADSEPKDERLLVVIAYLLALNIGVHLATYLAALAILPFAFLYEKRLAIPISFVAVLCMAQDVQFFFLVVALLLLPTLQFALLPSAYSRQHRTTLIVAHAAAFGLVMWGWKFLVPEAPQASSLFRNVVMYASPVAAFLLPWVALPAPKELKNPFQDLGFMLGLVTVLGFTCHLYLPIRSALNPAINEAQPDNWRAFWDVILRLQYRPVSVFERQATWVYQFDHMFWRYFREQWRPEFLWLLGIPGIFVHLKKAPRSFVLFGLLFVWSSFALVFKMNFTDHEVRERDYFFAPGFFYFTAWMGIALGWLSHLVVSGANRPWRRPLMVGAAALSIVIAVLPIDGHWETHDRRGNWVAHDYAYNMLAPLEQDAVLFTNGDNDTFPLWYLQEVKGFRKDVRVVNLSLLNTPWYGEQLRDEAPKVPTTLTTEQIRSLYPFRTQDNQIVLVKDQMTADILRAVVQQGSERPVYFAVTVDDLMNLEDRLRLEGLVFRFYPDGNALEVQGNTMFGDTPVQDDRPIPDVVREVDLVKTRRNLEEVFQYRGLLNEEGELDDAVYRDSNEQRLVTNYAAGWARMSLSYRAQGDMEESVKCMERAVAIAPTYEPIVSSLGSLYIEAKMWDKVKEFYINRVETNPDSIDSYIGLAYAARMSDGNEEEALDWYLRATRVDPNNRTVMAGMYQSYTALGRLEEARTLLIRWLDLHPTDESARDVLKDLEGQILRRDAGIAPSSDTLR